MRRISSPAPGFTLVELIVTMVITGIVAGIVATFIRYPVEAYVDAARRAGLTDQADTALRRMARDVQSALPNTVRLSGNFAEFIPIKDAGRYCAVTGSGGAPASPCADPLEIDSTTSATVTDAGFQVYAPGVTIQAGDSVVVYNLGITGASAYTTPPATAVATNSTRRSATTTGAALTSVGFTVGGQGFPLASPSSRFQVIGTPVTYECAPDATTPANGVIRKYWNYPIQSAQPATAATLNGLAGVKSAVLVGNVRECSFDYGVGLHQDGILVINLVLEDSGEAVTLLHQIPVVNSP